MAKWKCKICGYIYEGEELPEGFTCPVCRQPASVFEKVEEKDQKGAGRMERRDMEHGIRLKMDVQLPKKLLLCDDTITTGSTLKGALHVLDHNSHRIEIYCVSANHFWIQEKKGMLHFPYIQK